MTPRSLFAALSLAALCACAGTPDVMTEDQRADALGDCFRQFENYPTQLNRCINEVRTAEALDTPQEAAED